MAGSQAALLKPSTGRTSGECPPLIECRSERAGAQPRTSPGPDLRLRTLRIQGMEKSHRETLPLVALIWLVGSPAPAVAGYDIAHIVERTCEPGGPLIVADEWKRSKDQDRVLTEPGEVIVCPPAGPKNSLQIAAGPERIGREPYLCTYVSLFNGDGADACLGGDSAEDGKARLQPLMAVLPSEGGPLTLVGIAGDEIDAVAVAPGAGNAQEPTVTPIDAERAARLGAARAFSYFSLSIDRRALCADEPPRLLGRDSSDQRIAESPVPFSTRLLSAADRVPYARSLRALCASRASNELGTSAWLTEMGTVFRSLLKGLF